MNKLYIINVDEELSIDAAKSPQRALLLGDSDRSVDRYAALCPPNLGRSFFQHLNWDGIHLCATEHAHHRNWQNDLNPKSWGIAQATPSGWVLAGHGPQVTVAREIGCG
jgi:hypothetical protein